LAEKGNPHKYEAQLYTINHVVVVVVHIIY